MAGKRTAVYVPGALWDAAAELYPTDGDSALVQRGLRALVASWEGTPEFDALIESIGDAAIFGDSD